MTVLESSFIPFPSKIVMIPVSIPCQEEKWKHRCCPIYLCGTATNPCHRALQLIQKIRNVYRHTRQKIEIFACHGHILILPVIRQLFPFQSLEEVWKNNLPLFSFYFLYWFGWRYLSWYSHSAGILHWWEWNFNQGISAYHYYHSYNGMHSSYWYVWVLSETK